MGKEGWKLLGVSRWKTEWAEDRARLELLRYPSMLVTLFGCYFYDGNRLRERGDLLLHWLITARLIVEAC